MKFLVIALVALVAFANALEREQDFGSESESLPAEGTTAPVPVRTVKPNVRDDDDGDDSGEGDSDGSRPTECSGFLCSAMCRRSGCQDAVCLSNNRCGCVCARQVSPQDFFRRIFGNGYTPRYGQHVPTFPRIFDFPTMPRFEDSFRDLSKLLETLNKNDGSFQSSKVYYTMQHSCEQPEDCSHACANCTTTSCVNNFCQCMTCNNRDAIETRSLGKAEKTCSVARECDDMCKGCSKTGCRYGSCQCGKCEEPATTTEESVTSTTETTFTDDSGTTMSSDAEETSTVSVNIFRLRPSNLAKDDVTVDGKCVPKRCNHACWERQCSKWNCSENRCECDGCPDDMSVVVKNADGRASQPEDTNKYEIIF